MKQIIVFVLLAVLLDRGLGAVLARIERQSFTGDRGGLLNYALMQEPQVLVLGSSRAQYHIMPSVLTRELGLTAYNAGLKGEDFLYAVMLYDLWKRRHPPPKILVLTIEIESLIPRETEINAAHFVAVHLDESPLVREILYSGSPFKPFEYLSSTYRFNGGVLSLLKHAFDRPPPGYDGFAVGPGAFDPASETGVLNALDQDRTAAEMAHVPFSPQKLGYLRALAEEAARNGTRFFLVHTPLFRQDEAAHAFWVHKLQATLSDMPGVQFVDLCIATHPGLFTRPELYRNLNHLNLAGAENLTALLAEEIKKRPQSARLAVTRRGHVPESASTPRTLSPKAAPEP
jgi:hypothetical protein